MVFNMDYLIMCIGNRDGGDDSVGPYIADLLKNSKIEVIDSGTIPENYTGFIKQKKPDNLIIIDAIEMGLKPGEIRIVPKEKISEMTISTHGIPISILINYLSQYIDNILLIGIQPVKMSGEMTDKIIQSANELIEIIKQKNFLLIKKLR